MPSAYNRVFGPVRVVERAPGATVADASVLIVPLAGTVTGVTTVYDATITATGVSNATETLINKGLLGTGTLAVATKAFNTTVPSTAYVSNTLTLSTTTANVTVQVGETLALNRTGSAGITSPAGLVYVTITGNW